MLPIGMMLVLINMINPGYSDVLFHDPIGQKMLMGGVVLLCMGGLTIRHIINAIEGLTVQLLFFVRDRILASAVLALAVLPFVLKPSAQAARMMELVTSTRPDKRTVHVKERTQEKLLSVAKRRARAAGPRREHQAEGSADGCRHARCQHTRHLFCGATGGAVAGCVRGELYHPSQNTLFWVMAFAGVGYLLPDMWLTRMIKRRSARIRKSIPDAVDLLAICVEAGLGMDQALLRVGDEIRSGRHHRISMKNLRR